MSISTFIVVKNEAETLMQTLVSAAKFSDEIVIGVDDTSDDRTIDIIGEFLPSFDGEVEIYEFEWNDNFAEARNLAIERCTGDWIFQLDGHEHLRPGDEAKIRELTERLPDNIWLVATELWDEWRGGIPNSRFSQDHLWRNANGIVYDGEMHNFISTGTCPPEKRIKCSDIVIFHKRTDENAARRKTQRLEMAEKVFLPKIEKDPYDLRSLFYLAQTYLNSEILDKAEKYYTMFIERSEEKDVPSESEHAWAYYKRGMIALARADYARAADHLFTGLRQRADSPEIWLALGETFMLQEKPREAERFLVTAANTQPEEDHLFRYGFALGHGPWLRLMQLYFGQEDYSKAFRAGMFGLGKAPESGELLEGVRASLSRAAEKIETDDPKRKNLYVVDATGQFTGRLIEEWEKEYNVIVHKRVDYSYMTWADITFIEWADQNLYEAAQHKFECRLITRMHRYEVYRPLFKQINWENVDVCVFTSEHIKTKAGELPCETTIIENSVDPERFPPLKEFNEFNLCYVGYIHKRKNLGYLIDLLSGVNQKYKLHVAGEFQDEEYKEFILHQIKALGMEKRVIFHGWQEDINAWYEEVKPIAILSGSTSEGLPYSILEAMAKGIRPMIYNYPGAVKQFKDEFIFTDNKIFKKKLLAATSNLKNINEKYKVSNSMINEQAKYCKILRPQL